MNKKNKIIKIFSIICISCVARAQQPIWQDERLNTAKNANFMQPEEREMIYEINRLRSDPKRYATSFIKPKLDKAIKIMQQYGKGNLNYSLTTTYVHNKPANVDTIWHFTNEEELNACQTLYDTLMHILPLTILQPDEGIYNACVKHAKDQAPTNSLSHQGRDGSWPFERVKKFSPRMKDGNENIAYNSNRNTTARMIVLQLVIDSGIPDYGHRYNTLNASWTHLACYFTRPPMMKAKWWIQEYGSIK